MSAARTVRPFPAEGTEFARVADRSVDRPDDRSADRLSGGVRANRWRRALGAGALLALPALGVAQDGAGPAGPARTVAPAATGSLAEANEKAERDVAAESVVRLDGPRTKTEIVKTYAKRVLLPPGVRWTDAGGFDENVVSVTAEDNASLRLYAASPGVTQVDLLAVDAEGRELSYTIDVLVTADARALQAAVNRLFPGTSVEVYGLTDTSVVLRGWITRPEQVAQIVDVAGQYFPKENILNQMRVAAPQQVQLNVTFMEVQRSKARELGINLSWFGEDGFFSSTVGDVVPLAGIGGSGSGQTGIPLGGSPSLAFPQAAVANPTLAAGIVGTSGVFQAFIRALREERLLKVLSEPVQVASNGRPSYFQAGGEFPIPIPQGLGAVGIEYRPYGVELSAVPIILGGGRVRLELAASVSDLDFSRGTTISGTTVPGLSQRQTNTQVELEFGKTLMIAGLIQNTQQAAAQKLPFLGELPGIGAAFRRVKFEEAETELVILVTPHPVAGLNPSEVPCGGPGRGTAAPTTRELFNFGLLEVPGHDPCGPDCPPAGCPVDAAVPAGFPAAGLPADDLPPMSSPQVFAPQGVPQGYAPRAMPSAGGQSPWHAAPTMPATPMQPGVPSYTSPAPLMPGDARYPGQGAPVEPAPAPLPTDGRGNPTPGAAPGAAPDGPTLGPQARGFAPGRSAVAPAAYQVPVGSRAPAGSRGPAAYQVPAGYGAGRVTAPTPIRR